MQYTFENCVLDIPRRELRRDGVCCPVEPQVFDLLVYLIENRERVVGRDEIFRAVWHGRIVSDSVLGTRINAVRQAIADDGAQQRLIRTVRGRGFQFAGTVFAGGPSSPPSAEIPPRRLAVALNDGPVLAIRPFACVAASEDARLLAAALAEEIAADLHSIDWLRVAWMDASDRREHRAARHDRPRYSLQGFVRREHDRIRAIIRMTDAATGIQLWAERFSCGMPGWIDEIAATTARSISDHIFAAESLRSGQKRPESVGVWDSIVGAVALMNTRKKQDIITAQALLRKAISIDPKSAPCFSLLSIMATLSVHLGWKAQATAQPIAQRAAEKAVDLNSEDGWSHVALGYARLLIDNRPEEAIDVLATALRLNPNLAIAHYFIALASAYTGNSAASFRHADLAEQLAPRDLLALGNAGVQDNVRATASFVAGHYQDGISFAQKTIALSPRQTSAYRQLVLNHAFAGEREQAAAALTTIRTLAPNIPRWLQQQESRWSNRHDHQKYVDAFRLAGMK